MRRITAVLLLSSLTSCAQWCDCANKSQANDENTQATAVVESNSGVSSTEDDSLYTRPMREAPPVDSADMPSQLDVIANDPNAQPLNLDRSFVRATEKPALTRKMLPSEIAQASHGQASYGQPHVSNHPELIHSKKQLSDYAQQMAFKLMNFEALKGARVGVASFVEFDETLQATTPLGNQFAEALATVLPQYGVDIIEFKLTKNLAVGMSGDLALSRQIDELHEEVGMDYVLTGTLVTTRRGVQVNSRVVSVSDQRVIASASTLLPNLVLQQIQP